MKAVSANNPGCDTSNTLNGFGTDVPFAQPHSRFRGTKTLHCFCRSAET